MQARKVSATVPAHARRWVGAWALAAGLCACEPFDFSDFPVSGPWNEVDDAVTARSESPAPRPQPKPGERVRQPELDGYCSEAARPSAFYYHGGRPVVRLAQRDGCAPLYLTECDARDGCAEPREQEAGMWCCAPSAVTRKF